MPLAYLADMNTSSKTVAVLSAEGIDIVRVNQFLPAWSPDHEVLQLARDLGRVLVTQDLDFSMLVALGGFRRPSLLTFRMTVSAPAAVAARFFEVLPLVEAELSQGGAVTVEDSSIRIRRLPIMHEED